MKKILFSLVILSLLISGFSILAQDNSLPSTGLTPDNPFYFLKVWKEQIQLFFTFGAENKAKQYLHLSDVRLAEYQKMIEKGKTEIAQKTLDKYEKQLNRAIEITEELKNKGKDVKDISQRLEDTVRKHISVLEQNLQKVPESGKKGIENAIEKSSKVLEKFKEKEITCVNKCGDGKCDEVVCMAVGCPCPETKENCPQDCKEEKQTEIPPCQNECSQAGLKRCSDNGYQTCGEYDSDGCLEWSSVNNCPSNATCQNGDCIQQKCSDGTLLNQCSTNKPSYCENGNLINKCSICGCPSGKQCQSNGSCTISIQATCQNECSPVDSKRCSDNGYQVCGNYDTDDCLEWSPITNCSSDTICQNGICIQKKTVAILIDRDTYSKITAEIDQYSSDIKKDLDVNVKLISEDWKTNQIPDPQIFEVKDKLKDLYKNNGLLGAVLIGNVPMVWFDSEKTLTGEQTGDYVSDYWYMNIDGNFQDTDGDGMFNWKTNYHLEQESLPEIWIGRIKPPVLGQEGIDLLKNYFYRNHRYRIGGLQNNKKILWLHTIALAEESTVTTGGDLEKWYKESGAYDSINWSKAWKIEDTDIVFNNSGDKEERLEKASQEYLNKLQNNQYEFIAYSGHGTESYQEYGISSEDIKSIKPKAYFGVFMSCSLGDYSSENYIGGWYLFAGNGLAMLMRTFPSLGTAPNIQDLYLLVNGGGLNQGKIFGEAFKYHVGYVSWQATALLGDPTLKLRY